MRLIDADALLEKMKGTNRYFQVKSDIEVAPTIEAAPVVHGRWIHTNKHRWYKNDDGTVCEWEWDYGFHNGPECQACGESPCVHCKPDWEEKECPVGYYYCSKCHEESADAHEHFCPSCGARMDGEEKP